MRTVAIPAHAADVSEWQDVDTVDAYRTVSSLRRHVGEDFVEAYCLQNPDGSLEEQAVRAQIDATPAFSQHWDHPLSPIEARAFALRLGSAAADLIKLSQALLVAADEVEVWTR